jgi:hypothetical protein
LAGYAGELAVEMGLLAKTERSYFNSIAKNCYQQWLSQHKGEICQAQEDPVVNKLKCFLKDNQHRIIDIKGPVALSIEAVAYTVTHEGLLHYFLSTSVFKKIMGSSRTVIEFLVKKKILLPGTQAKTYTRQYWAPLPRPGKNMHGYLLNPRKLGL